MSFEVDNLRSLNEKDPHLVSKLKSFRPNIGPQVSAGTIADEIQIVFPDASQNFCEKFSTSSAVEIWPHTRLLIFFGFGIGSQFYSLYKKILEKAGQMEVLIIEQDPQLFSLALQICDLKPILNHSKFHFWIGMDLEEIKEAFLKFFVRTGRGAFVNAIQIVSHPDLVKRDEAYYRGIERAANNVLHYASHLYGNSSEDGFRGFVNVFKNVKVIANSPSIHSLEGKFKNIPAIVIASGPSLDRELETLRSLQDRAILIAADSALKPLMDAGIRPHFVTAIERDPIVPEFIKEFSEIKDIALVACPVVVPETFENWKGPKLMAFRNFEYFEYFADPAELKPLGPTCGNMAFFVAARLGCSPVILVGQDLAYDSKDFRSHVRGTVFKERDQSNSPQDLIKRGFFPVAGNFEGEVLTEQGLYLALLSYEKALLDDPVECYNTSFGAKIRGSRPQHLSQLLDQKLSLSFPKLRSNILSVIADQDSTKALLKWSDLKVKIPNLISHLSEIRNKNLVAIQCLKNLEGDSSLEKFREEVVKAEAWCVELQDQNLTFRNLIKPIVTPFLVNAQIELNSKVLELSKSDTFFSFCHDFYLRFLEEIDSWVERIEDIIVEVAKNERL